MKRRLDDRDRSKLHATVGHFSTGSAYGSRVTIAVFRCDCKDPFAPRAPSMSRIACRAIRKTMFPLSRPLGPVAA